MSAARRCPCEPRPRHSSSHPDPPRLTALLALGDSSGADLLAGDLLWRGARRTPERGPAPGLGRRGPVLRVTAAPRDPRLLVVAIGGTALREPGSVAAPAAWFRQLERTLPPLVDLVARGFRLVLTHGSGAQVGDELVRMEVARKIVPPLSLDLCGAETQGSLGYAIQQVFGNLCRARKLDVPAATLVTRVTVDPGDAAFRPPTTPIGPLYSAGRARQLEREHGWTMVEGTGRRWRRVVASPRPLAVLEVELVRRLVMAGAVTITCGGGGVPVVQQGTAYHGVDAVVEKDYSTELLATRLGAERLVFLTGVERAAVRYGTPQEIGIERLTLEEARALLTAGEFAPGSMGPKIEAGVRFVDAGGREAIVTSADRIRAALEGEAGTRVVTG